MSDPDGQNAPSKTTGDHDDLPRSVLPIPDRSYPGTVTCTATLSVDGQDVGSVGVEHTHPTMFGFDETTDVGRATGSPVTPDDPAAGNAFTGTVAWVRSDLGDDDHGDQVPAEHHFQVAMSRR